MNNGDLGIPDQLPSGRRAPHVPTAAHEIITAARSTGWLCLAYWNEDADGALALTVRVARTAPRRHFELVWHAADATPLGFSLGDFARDVSTLCLSLVRVRHRRRGQWCPVPSVESVHRVIAATRHLRIVADQPQGLPTDET